MKCVEIGQRYGMRGDWVLSEAVFWIVRIWNNRVNNRYEVNIEQVSQIRSSPTACLEASSWWYKVHPKVSLVPQDVDQQNSRTALCWHPFAGHTCQRPMTARSSIVRSGVSRLARARPAPAKEGCPGSSVKRLGPNSYPAFRPVPPRVELPHLFDGIFLERSANSISYHTSRFQVQDE